MYPQKPLYDETTHFLHSLMNRCLDDWRGFISPQSCGVDVDSSGAALFITDGAQWESHLANRFAVLNALSARQAYDILSYEGCCADGIAFSELRFWQQTTIGDDDLRQYCTATIVWAQDAHLWRVRRWHCTTEYAERIN